VSEKSYVILHIYLTGRGSEQFVVDPNQSGSGVGEFIIGGLFKGHMSILGRKIDTFSRYV
ncbi:hypothetical protein, partial [Corynebacterium glutamicum]|uniref:hypothetical protein n=1 Tax=Corynebacterium glutamicum TaxID=1718 RepID=UPI0005551E95